MPAWALDARSSRRLTQAEPVGDLGLRRLVMSQAQDLAVSHAQRVERFPHDEAVQDLLDVVELGWGVHLVEGEQFAGGGAFADVQCNAAGDHNR